MAYTYPAAGQAHPHAVTARSNGDQFQYDANGNVTHRLEGGVTYTQTFDADLRPAHDDADHHLPRAAPSGRS